MDIVYPLIIIITFPQVESVPVPIIFILFITCLVCHCYSVVQIRQLL